MCLPRNMVIAVLLCVEMQRGDGMSVLIKGMEMPERCGMCFLRVGNCKQRIYMEQRPKACPLIEIPTPHGRLVDADKLFEEINIADEYGADMSDILMLVLDAPTVIEAEGRDE